MLADEDHRRESWHRHKETLLAQEGTARGRPGSRPWAFWRYEAPEALRQPDDPAESLPGEDWPGEVIRRDHLVRVP